MVTLFGFLGLFFFFSTRKGKGGENLDFGNKFGIGGCGKSLVIIEKFTMAAGSCSSRRIYYCV